LFGKFSINSLLSTIENKMT